MDDKTVEQVESPEDWVTQDRVHMRVGLDQFRWISVAPYHKFEGDWRTYDGFGICYRHGDFKIQSKEYKIELRCHRKDLPEGDSQ